MEKYNKNLLCVAMAFGQLFNFFYSFGMLIIFLLIWNYSLYCNIKLW